MNRFLPSSIRLPHWGTLLTLGDQAIVSGSNFLVGILLTRWMGLAAYGQFALAWMGVLLGLALQQALVQMPMMTLRPQMPQPQHAAYDRGVWTLNLLWVGAAGILTLVASWVSTRLYPDWGLEALFPWLPLGIVCLLAQDFFRRYGFVKSTIGLVLIIDILAYGGLLLGLGILQWMDALSIARVYAVVSGSFGLGALVALLYFRLWPRLRGLGTVWRAHARFSAWLLGKAGLQFFASNYFVLAAGALLGTTAIGALRMAQNLLGVTHVLFQAMENIVPVRAAQAWGQNAWPGLRRYLRLMSLRSGLGVGLLLLLLALLGRPLIAAVYGAEYVAYYPLLLGYCLLYVFIFLGYPLRFALRTMEITQPIFWAYVLSTAFSLLSAQWIVQRWGLDGVLAGLILSQILMQIVYGGWLWSQIRRQPQARAAT